MKYFKNKLSGEVFGFDEDEQGEYVEACIIDTDTWEDVTGSWPPPPAAPPPQTQFTSLEFLDKFTDEEQLAVVSATLAIPQVKLWYDKMLAASYVDLEDPRTIGGLTALVAAGLLTEERKDEILEAV